jgi:uncharacterized membrane protein YdjX (TVP38/TMEM64 family)
MKRVLPIIFSALIIFLAISRKDNLLNLVQSESQVAIPVSIIFVALLVFFPVVPYVVLAGMIGSVFGIWLGTGISVIGIGIGTIIMFFLARYGFQEWTQSTLMKYPKIQEYEILFEQNAFISILLARVVPVIPSPVINILSGLSKVKWSVFLGASIMGKLPVIFIFTLAGSLMNQQKWVSIVIYGVYFIIIAILAGRKLQKKRYSEQVI